jgi:hypothetical protein
MDKMDQDKQHLKLLSIFHYVVGGLAALFACFPIIHLILGISMLTGNFFGQSLPTDEPFPFNLMAIMFTVIPLFMIMVGWAYAIAMIFAGTYLAKNQHYLFCMVMAALSCTFSPFGTALGVFTIIVLARPSVKELFNYPGAIVKK